MIYEEMAPLLERRSRPNFLPIEIIYFSPSKSILFSIVEKRVIFPQYHSLEILTRRGIQARNHGMHVISCIPSQKKLKNIKQRLHICTKSFERKHGVTVLVSAIEERECVSMIKLVLVWMLLELVKESIMFERRQKQIFHKSLTIREQCRN